MIERETERQRDRERELELNFFYKIKHNTKLKEIQINKNAKIATHLNVT